VIRVRPDGTVCVTVPRWGSRRHAEIFVQQERAWIERQLARMVTDLPRLAYTSEAIAELRGQAERDLPWHLHRLAAHHGLTVKRVTVRDQRSRWGSCSPLGHICLNWRLVLMPDEVRDYVLVHELMHLRRLDHSRHFWRLVARACPDHEEARRWLRENRLLLFDRANQRPVI
jgi:predicted metal-dependent hydrolase